MVEEQLGDLGIPAPCRLVQSRAPTRSKQVGVRTQIEEKTHGISSTLSPSSRPAECAKTFRTRPICTVCSQAAARSR